MRPARKVVTLNEAKARLHETNHMLDFRAQLAEPMIAGTLAGRQPAAGFGVLFHRPRARPPPPRRASSRHSRRPCRVDRGVVFADQTVHQLRIMHVAARHAGGVCTRLFEMGSPRHDIRTISTLTAGLKPEGTRSLSFDQHFGRTTELIGPICAARLGLQPMGGSSLAHKLSMELRAADTGHSK